MQNVGNVGESQRILLGLSMETNCNGRKIQKVQLKTLIEERVIFRNGALNGNDDSFRFEILFAGQPSMSNSR